MGELSIEEKAKRYDEAIKRAKAMIKVAANQDESIGFANTIFPELNESEDEKIRKTLIEYFNVYPKDYYGALKKSHIIAWLEKQGEKKPIEWKDSDEKYLFWALLSIQKDIAASEINGINTKDLNDCVRWLYSLKQRIKGE